MSRWYKYACAAVAIAICPGSIPVGIGYATYKLGCFAFKGYQAVRVRIQRRRLKRIIIAVGQGRTPWTETRHET